MVKINVKNVISALQMITHDKLSDFYTSSWQRGESPVPMLVVRILLSTITLAVVVWSIVEMPQLYLLIFLTNWGVLLVLATTVSGLAISWSAFRNKPTETKELPWFYRLYWVFFNMAPTISVIITILYWTLLYKPAMREEMGPRLFALDVMKHAVTSCLVMAELILSRTPVRLARVYQPLVVACVYSAFTVLYHLAGGTDEKGNKYIYSVLDWHTPQQTIIVLFGALAGAIVLYFTLWGIAFYRNKISTALLHKSQDVQNIAKQVFTCLVIQLIVV